ncbi:MAG: hypothetical protein GY906_23295 [bacterium]|nr:hypothetical protein [bacterium]
MPDRAWIGALEIAASGANFGVLELHNPAGSGLLVRFDTLVRYRGSANGIILQTVTGNLGGAALDLGPVCATNPTLDPSIQVGEWRSIQITELPSISLAGVFSELGQTAAGFQAPDGNGAFEMPKACENINIPEGISIRFIDSLSASTFRITCRWSEIN